MKIGPTTGSRELWGDGPQLFPKEAQKRSQCVSRYFASSFGGFRAGWVWIHYDSSIMQRKNALKLRC